MKKIFKYYEGTTSANTILRDLSKILCTANKTFAIKDDKGNVVKKPEVVMDKNWDIVYPQPQKMAPELQNVMDWKNLTPAEFVKKIENQISQIQDTVILKTKTTPKNVEVKEDDLGLEDDLSVSSIDMYVELYKPQYLIDCEQYAPDCERDKILPYLITKSIYKDFANKEDSVTINLKAATANIGTNPARNVIISYLTDSGTNTKTTLSETECKAYIKELKDKYNILVNEGSYVSYDGWSYSAQVPLEKFNLLLASSSELGDTVRTLYTPSDPSKEYSITIGFQRLYTGLGIKYYCLLSWSRQIEQYTINSGFTYNLEHMDTIKADTVALNFEDEVNGVNTLMSYFKYDKATNSIVCTKTGTFKTEVFGDPILTYAYTKENAVINAKTLLPNNHFIYVRMFDKINDQLTGPIPNTIDPISGEIKSINSNVSEWSKLSWYQDFTDVYISTLTSDSGVEDISEGTIHLPLETPGLNGDTRLKFWINTNNDRVLLMVMGNPSLDFNSNRHLISSAYIGQIDSFKGGINDVAGNFALFTSSSTPPCLSKTISKKISQSAKQTIGVGDGYTKKFTFRLDDGKFYDKTISTTIAMEKVNNDTHTFSTLREAQGYTITLSDDERTIIVEMFTAPEVQTTLTLNYNFYVVKTSSEKGLIRDGLGNIINVTYPSTYGLNTATGVIDVSMLHTRSKAYFQKHHFMFNTTEEFMTKEQFGKSAYTGDYYADQIKIVHGNDGVRGFLDDVLVIDKSSLYNLDELTINKDFEKDADKPEEKYIFFNITAPYTPLADSPNATYGLAIKESEILPAPKDDEEAVTRAIDNELYLYVGNLKGLTEDIYLPTELSNGVTVTWGSSDAAINIENGGKMQ